MAGAGQAGVSARDSRPEYQARMHRVLEHIDKHLDQPLDLKTLAKVAHFSPFHFHRLFAAWMGERLGDFLRRRRIEVAAMRLIAQPNTSVLPIALSVGFGSAEAFTRAFKVHFGSSPTVWRRQQLAERAANRNPGQAIRKQDQASATAFAKDGVSHTTPSEPPMNVKLIDRKDIEIAYLRHTGPYGDPILGFWMHDVSPWMATNNLFGLPRYGISHDDPSITAPAKCRYDAGVEIPPGFVLSGKAHKTTIPGGRYAALAYKGTAGQIVDAWTALLRDWLSSSGLQLDSRPCFEYYPLEATFDPKTGVFECDICIPVVPL